MPEFLSHVPLVFWVGIAILSILSALFAYEFLGLPKRRMEGLVLRKKHFPPVFDPVATVSVYGDDAGIGSARETPEQYIVTFQVDGRDLYIRVEPELFRAVEENSTVICVCSIGRLSGALFAETIELPMPDKPKDQPLHS